MLVVQIQARDADDLRRSTTGFETLVGTVGEAERALADLVGARRAGAAARALSRFEDVELSSARYPEIRAAVSA
jgi:hypothetical protein